MRLNTPIITNGDEGRIDKANARAQSKTTEQIEAQPTEQMWHPLHEASLADQMRKLASQIYGYMILIVGLEGSIVAWMKVDHYSERFAIAQLPGSPPSLVTIPQ